MAQETSKASERRLKDKTRDWKEIFQGYGIEVGPGDDPLVINHWPWPSVVECDLLDKKDGDANKIDEVKRGPYDFIHGSQVMEHLYNPGDFINRCLKILKPGGWIVMTVPDYDLYEKRRFPSRFNPDHKTTWSLWRTAVTNQNHPRASHIFVPEWTKQFDVAQRYATLIDTNYDYLAPDTKDQTWLREDGVECFIEILLQKHG